ncbi:TolC family protein [Chitinophaga pendula]|uniref:TolC family protein n=1 Tax=Chitinophaga TaxID=79328 RepID=UPI000BAFBB97|nr:MULTISPECIES: TolC family protein [Chitinophaga]ASZ12749.1 transporter [Chitinophaga sp. MD30]UCJ09631.1 TolC family protein [Chitinophaga pendula]
MKQILLIIAFTLTITLTRTQTQAQQTERLEDILSRIATANPALQMYDAEARSMDAAAKGARSWMPPQVGAGFFMTPYNVQMWKRDPMMGTTGMGSFMISGEQMIPSKKKQNTEAAFMGAMSAVEKEKKSAALNELLAQAKQFYFEWLIMKKKLTVINENERLLHFMLRSAELRFKNGLDKVNGYYKAQAALGNVAKMRQMTSNEIRQRRIRLNTLMNRNSMTEYDIDTAYIIHDYSAQLIDTATMMQARSDIKAIEQDIRLASLQQVAEKAKLKPDFGVKYDHMFGFGGQPAQFSLMGMVKLPFVSWASKMNKAKIESLQWKQEALTAQKNMLLNEATGMAFGMRAEMETARRQVALYENNILPALKRNYQSMQLAYEQNTEELFMLFDAWETLNMAQQQYLDQLQQVLMAQVQLEKVLEIK